MVGTVLGKRTRSAAADSPAASTRAKRRVLEEEVNDENTIPCSGLEVVADSEDEEELELSIAVPKRRLTTRATPKKHASPIAPSPAKINAHFKSQKQTVDVYQDGKGDATPKTPRHRDALSKKVPVTPRHRLVLASSNTTPRTPNPPSNASTAVYNQARQLFSRCCNPGRLVGRENERQELASFVEKCAETNSGGCLYISGPPGTGKSALVDEVCQKYRDTDDVELSVVNCMSVRNTKDLSGKLSEDFGLKEDAGFEYLRSCFVRGKANDNRKYVVILDEVDRLVDLDLALLYSLFEWSMQDCSRLILIGIANALDLTDRFLPRLKSKNLRPELLPFMPYSAAQIAEVLTTKLKSLSAASETTVPFLHPTAIQFCAKKVAAQTGDLRKAFDICRRAIDLVEQETKDRDAKPALPESPSKTPLMENINLSSPTMTRTPSKSALKSRPMTTIYTFETAPKATIAHMAKVTAQAFSNGTTQRLATLNLQQKAVLCALAALEKRNRGNERSIFATPSKHNRSAPTIKQLFEAYSSLCKRENLFHPLSSMEFRDVVSGLETLSLISAADSKNGSFVLPVTPSKTPGRRGKGGFGGVVAGDERRVASVIGMKELDATLDGPGGELMREILEGGGL